MKAYMPLAIYPLAIVIAVGIGSSVVSLVSFKDAPSVSKLTLPGTLNSLDLGLPELADASSLTRLLPPMMAASVGYKKNGNSREKKYYLHGVMIDGDRRFANISGKLLTVNEKIGIYRVARIQENHVLLKSKEQSIRLRVY